MSNPIEFKEGTTIKNVHSGKVYVITNLYKNGMCNLYCRETRSNEHWNACNNAHFIELTETVELGVLICL